MMMIDDAHVFM